MTKRIVPYLVAAVFFALLLRLGFWQLERSEEKAERLGAYALMTHTQPISIATVDSSLPDYQLVRLGGRFLQADYLLDNRTRNGKAGYQVLTPFVLTSGEVILVNRGWIAAYADRRRTPPVPRPARGGVTGRLAPWPRIPTLGDSGYGSTQWPKVVQRLEAASIEDDLTRISPSTQLHRAPRLAPRMVWQEAGVADGLIREWSPYLGISPARHRAYAFQWFSLAATLLVITGVMTRRRSV